MTQRGAVAVAVGLTHQEPGRVLEVRDQVRELRRGLSQRGLDAVEVPPGVAQRVGQRRAHQPGAAQAECVDRIGIDRRFDHHPVAGPGQRPGDGGDGGQGAGRDDDLLGLGRQPAGGEGLGHPRLQFGQSRRQIAVLGQIRRKGGQRPLSARHGPGGGGARGDTQIHRVAARRHAERVADPVVDLAAVDGNGGEGARPLPRHREAGRRKFGVGPGDRRP